MLCEHIRSYTKACNGNYLAPLEPRRRRYHLSHSVRSRKNSHLNYKVRPVPNFLLLLTTRVISIRPYNMASESYFIWQVKERIGVAVHIIETKIMLKGRRQYNICTGLI